MLDQTKLYARPADATVDMKCFTETHPRPRESKLYARPDQAVPSGVLIWRDSSLPRQHQDVVEAPQRIHNSHVSLLCERGHQTDCKLMTINCNHRVLQEACICLKWPLSS